MARCHCRPKNDEREVVPVSSWSDEQSPVTGTSTPPLRSFVNREFAVHSPFWSRLIFERLGGILAYLFAGLRTPPSAVTLLGGAFGVLGATLLGLATTAADVLVAGTCLLTGYTLDCADGQLARATHRTSASGAWLDVTTDAVTTCFLAVALCVALLEDGGSPLYGLLIAGFFSASRVLSLFTANRVSGDAGGIPLTDRANRLRRVFTAAIDTPFVYVVLCSVRLSPPLLRAVIIAIALLSLVKAVVSARHHFSAPRLREESES
jgi:phosphatidylglycerophosphate synthase